MRPLLPKHSGGFHLQVVDKDQELNFVSHMIPLTLQVLTTNLCC